MLEVEALTASAGDFRLSDVSLVVAQGECHAVLGPSGSGKSTLLNVILGVLPPASGHIRLAGVDLTRLPIEQRGLGYVPQGLGLFPHLSVRDNLAYSARARGMPAGQFRPVVDRLVEATGIGALLDRRPATLSGGERQRVGLVRALASQPRLVLLDEPFTALNDSLRRELWWLLHELQREWRLTVLLITHDLAEAYFLAGQVTVLLDGRVVQQGEKTEVYGRPTAPEVARFLGVETLQPGRVLHVSDGLATIEVGSARLTALAQPDMPADVLVSIRGEEVILQRERGSSSSARNALPARVVSVRPGSPLLCVELDAGFPLIALVTRPACEELELRPGLTVTACVKAPSVHLVGRSVPEQAIPIAPPEAPRAR
jgi:molybdopterin-binding protein